MKTLTCSALVSLVLPVADSFESSVIGLLDQSCWRYDLMTSSISVILLCLAGGSIKHQAVSASNPWEVSAVDTIWSFHKDPKEAGDRSTFIYSLWNAPSYIRKKMCKPTEVFRHHCFVHSFDSLAIVVGNICLSSNITSNKQSHRQAVWTYGDQFSYLRICKANCVEPIAIHIFEMCTG